MDACADKAQLGSGPMPAAGWALGPGLDSTQLAEVQNRCWVGVTREG